MRKLIPLKKAIEQAADAGEDIDFMVVDPDDIFSIDPDDLESSQKNPDEDSDSED